MPSHTTRQLNLTLPALGKAVYVLLTEICAGFFIDQHLTIAQQVAARSTVMMAAARSGFDYVLRPVSYYQPITGWFTGYVTYKPTREFSPWNKKRLLVRLAY